MLLLVVWKLQKIWNQFCRKMWPHRKINSTCACHISLKNYWIPSFCWKLWRALQRMQDIWILWKYDMFNEIASKTAPKKAKNQQQQNPTNLCCFYILYYINKKIIRSKIFLLTNCTLKTYLFMLCPTVELYALRYFVESFQICYAISLYSQLVCYLYPVYYLFRICQA